MRMNVIKYIEYNLVWTIEDNKFWSKVDIATVIYLTNFNDNLLDN